MYGINSLGKLVRRDRELQGLNQEQLAEKLNKETKRPLDPYTKKPKVFQRGWIAKLEADILKREIRSEIREMLAKVLNGDAALYNRLPTDSPENPSVPEDFDVLPLLKHLIRSKKKKLLYGELCRICEAEFRCSQIGVSLTNPP